MPESCSIHSTAVGEQLTGTATRVDYWFLLEYPGAFGKNAYDEAALPASVREHINLALGSAKNSHIQLIRREETIVGGPVHFFVVVNHEEEPNLYAFLLPDYEALLDLDLGGILAERQELWKFDRKEPLFLVCTNGKRDACCARSGLPVFEVLKGVEPSLGNDSVWQTSHQGGHRFAPVLVCLPHGVVYGRFISEKAPDLCREYVHGQVALANYRGRSCYAPHVQAAETFLRQKTGDLALGAYKLIEVTPDAEGTWMFYFRERNGGASHCVQVRKESAPYQVYQSCRDEQPSPQNFYRLLDYQRHT